MLLSKSAKIFIALVNACIVYACLTSTASAEDQSAYWFDIDDSRSEHSSDHGNTVVSINLCSDQLVMLLAHPDHILSLSNLAHQPEGSFFFDRARQYPTTQGNAESILTLAPDLVIAGEYTTRYTVSLLRELGVRVEILPIANSIDMMMSNIKQVATWLNVDNRAQPILEGMKQRLAQLEVDVSGISDRSELAVFDANGYTVGRNTLRGEMITRSGWTNSATLVGIDGYGKLSLESLVRLSPDALLDSPYSPGTFSRARQITAHPAISAAGLNPLVISVPSREVMCAGPWTIDVMKQLYEARNRLTGDAS